MAVQDHHVRNLDLRRLRTAYVVPRTLLPGINTRYASASGESASTPPWWTSGGARRLRG